MCVQNFDDSREIAIRITYRISLRSSSLWEPRHPLLKVVSYITLVIDGPKSHDSHPAHGHVHLSFTFIRIGSVWGGHQVRKSFFKNNQTQNPRFG